MTRKKKASAGSHQKPLHEFYTDEQKHEMKQDEEHHKHREHIEKIEMEIFEHLKNHTKKVLREKGISKR